MIKPSGWETLLGNMPKNICVQLYYLDAKMMESKLIAIKILSRFANMLFEFHLIKKKKKNPK